MSNLIKITILVSVIASACGDNVCHWQLVNNCLCQQEYIRVKQNWLTRVNTNVYVKCLDECTETGDSQQALK